MESIISGKSEGWKNILKILIPYFIVVGISQLIGFYFAGLNISTYKNYKNIHEATTQLFIIMYGSKWGRGLKHPLYFASL